jgi:predicted signal transduction protein with EAL and GGDEF domain
LRDGVARKAGVLGPKGEKLAITASFGVANFPRNAASASELVWLADEAMYLAKERGRNRVCGADILPETEDATVMASSPRQRRTTGSLKVRLKRPTLDPVPKRRTTKQPKRTQKVK